MFNVKLVLEYDGSAFHGWQMQPNARTVQGELKKTISLITKYEANIVSAGRTDAGVHARAQVCNFMLPEKIDLDRFRKSISGILKHELSVISAEYVDLNFHALRDVKYKQYSYYILNRDIPPVNQYGKVLFVPQQIDFDNLKSIFNNFVGTYDFQSFRASDCCAKTSIRTIDRIEISKIGDLIEIKFQAKGFLKNMIRIMVGTVLDILLGRINLSISEIIEKKDRLLAGKTAAAYGLYLDFVKYE